MTTALVTPPEDSQVLTPACTGSLLVCFTNSDDWKALVTLIGKLALPRNAAVHICYKDHTNLYPISSTTPDATRHRVALDSLPSSLHAAKALREIGLSVEFTDGAGWWQENRQQRSPSRHEDLIVMTTSFSGSMAFGSQNLASRAVRQFRKPILFFRAEPMGPATQDLTGPAVAAVSLSERSHEVVQEAAKYADTLGSALAVVHIVDNLHDVSRPDNLMSLMCACETLGRSVMHSGFQTYPQLTRGEVADVLTKADFIGRAPFVALGVDLSEHQTDAEASDALLETIVRNAPCPVLLIPENHKE